MEVDEIQCNKFPRMTNGNGRVSSAEMVKIDDEGEGERKRGGGVGTNGINLGGVVVGRYYGGWPSSRIVRVSRASGGKDRHSKVLTSKGLRDRRVRLSVNTAIQFYDLQDRLGYDQPSKAVEWLLKAAASSISELPPMNNPFPDTPKQLSYEKRSSSDQLGLDSVEMDMNSGDLSYYHNQQNQQNVTKSCSSNSENSKGSGLSLSRSEYRSKARERAKERVMEKEKEKEKENDSPHGGSLNPISHRTSFTELLNGGISTHVISNRHSNSNSPNNNGTTNEFFQKSQAQWASTPMDYFTTGLLVPTVSRPGPMQLPATPLFSVAEEHHPELQHFSFVPDHHLLAGNNNGSSEYNLNFSISSSGNNSSGFNRGTLQSNLAHLPRFSPHIDGPPPSFLIGSSAPVDNQHQFLSGFDGRLHFSYGDSAARRRGKGKN